jgi:hypothetical protein
MGTTRAEGANPAPRSWRQREPAQRRRTMALVRRRRDSGQLRSPRRADRSSRAAPASSRSGPSVVSPSRRWPCRSSTGNPAEVQSMRPKAINTKANATDRDTSKKSEPTPTIATKSSRMSMSPTDGNTSSSAPGGAMRPATSSAANSQPTRRGCSDPERGATDFQRRATAPNPTRQRARSIPTRSQRAHSSP